MFENTPGFSELWPNNATNINEVYDFAVEIRIAALNSETGQYFEIVGTPATKLYYQYEYTSFLYWIIPAATFAGGRVDYRAKVGYAIGKVWDKIEMLPEGISVGNEVDQVLCDPTDWNLMTHNKWVVDIYPCYTGDFRIGIYESEAGQSSALTGSSYNMVSVQMAFWNATTYGKQTYVVWMFPSIRNLTNSGGILTTSGPITGG